MVNPLNKKNCSDAPISVFISHSDSENDDTLFKDLIKNQSEGLSDLYKSIETTITTMPLRKDKEYKKS